MNLIQGIFLIDPAGIFKARNNMLVFYFANIHRKFNKTVYLDRLIVLDKKLSVLMMSHSNVSYKAQFWKN